MEDYKELKETEDKNLQINIDDDYLLYEGAEILSDYMILNQNNYLTEAA